MPRKLLGMVEESEKIRIQQLYLRQLSLTELIAMFKDKGEIASKNECYEKALVDFHGVHQDFHQWWVDTSSKYQWNVEPANNWFIDFDTNAVYLS